MLINSSSESSVFEICKSVITKDDFLSQNNQSLCFEIVVRPGGAKSRESEKTIAETTLELGSIVSQSGQKSKDRIALFLVAPEKREGKPAYRSVSNLVRVQMSQIFGHLTYETEIINSDGSFEEPGNDKIRKSKNVTVNLQITEIKGIKLSDSYMVIEISGFENDNVSKAIEIEGIDHEKVTFAFEQKFLINPSVFLSLNKKFAVIKLIEKVLDKKEQRLVGYAKMSLTGLNNYLADYRIDDSFSVIEKGLFELTSVQNITKGFLSIEMSVGKIYSMSSKTKGSRRSIVDIKNVKKQSDIDFETNIHVLNENEYRIEENHIESGFQNTPYEFIKKSNEENQKKLENKFFSKKNHKENPKTQINETDFLKKDNLAEFYKQNVRINHHSLDNLSHKTEINSETKMMGNDFETEQKLSVQSERYLIDDSFELKKIKNPNSQTMKNDKHNSATKEDSGLKFPTFNPYQNKMENYKEQKFEIEKDTEFHLFDLEKVKLKNEASTNLQVLTYFFDICVSKNKDPNFSESLSELSRKKEISNFEFSNWLKQNNFWLSEFQLNSFMNTLNYNRDNLIEIEDLISAIDKFQTLKLKILSHFFADLFSYINRIPAINVLRVLLNFLKNATDDSLYLEYSSFNNILMNLEIECPEERISDFQLLGYFDTQGKIFVPNVYNFMAICIKMNEERTVSQKLRLSLFAEIISTNIVAFFNFETYVEIESIDFLQEFCDDSFVQELRNFEKNNVLKIKSLFEFLKREQKDSFCFTILDVLLIFYKVYQFKNISFEYNKASGMCLDTISEFIAINQRSKIEMEDLADLINSKDIFENQELNSVKTDNSNKYQEDLRHQGFHNLKTQQENSKNEIESCKFEIDRKLTESFYKNSKIKELETKYLGANFQKIDNKVSEVKFTNVITSKSEIINQQNNELEKILQNQTQSQTNNEMEKMKIEQNKINKQDCFDSNLKIEELENKIIKINLNLLMNKISLSETPSFFEDKYFYLEFKIPEFNEDFESKIFAFADNRSDYNLDLQIKIQIPKSATLENNLEKNEKPFHLNFTSLKINFVCLSKIDKGLVFAQSLIQISDIQKEDCQSFITPDYSFFSKNKIEFSNPDLGILYYRMFTTESVEDNKDNNSKIISKEIRFKKEIPKRGFISFFLQRIEIEDNLSRLFDKISQETIDSFDYLQLEMHMAIDLPNNKTLQEVFFKKSFDKKNDFIAFFLKFKTNQNKMNSFLLKSQFDFESEQVNEISCSSFPIHLKCLLYDRFCRKLLDCKFSSGSFSISELFCNFNNNGIEMFVNLTSEVRASVVLKANYLEKDFLDLEPNEKAENLNFVHLQPLGLIGFSNQDSENKLLLELIRISDNEELKEIVCLYPCTILDSLIVSSFESKKELNGIIFETKEKSDKFYFRISQNSKNNQKKLSQSEIFDLKSIKKQNQKREKDCPFKLLVKNFKIGSFLLKTKIILCESAKLKNANTPKKALRLLESLKSPIFYNLNEFSEVYKLKLAELDSIISRSNKSSSPIRINKSEFQILVDEFELVEFLKIQFNFVKSEINDLMCLLNKVSERDLNISNLFPGYFENNQLLHGNNQTKVGLVKEILREFLYQDEGRIGELESDVFLSVLQRFNLLYDQTDIIKFSEVVGKNTENSFCYFIVLYKMIAEIEGLISIEKETYEKPQDSKKETHKREILKQSPNNNISLTKNRNFDISFLENVEMQISAIRVFNLNDLFCEKGNPNSFVILKLFYFNELQEWRSKMQPRNANPVFKNVYKLTQEEINVLKNNIDRQNSLDLYFRHFSSDMNLSIRDQKVATILFSFSEIEIPDCLKEKSANDTPFKIEINKALGNCRVQIEFSIKRKADGKANFSLTENFLKNNPDENEEIMNTLKTLKELSNTEIHKQNSNPDEKLFDFIKNNIQNNTPEPINQSSLFEFKPPLRLIEKSSLISKTNSKERFESFGEVCANEINEKPFESNQPHLNKRECDDSGPVLKEHLNQSSEESATNKSNPFANCLGNELNSVKNTFASEKLEPPKTNDKFTKKDGKESPLSKINSSESSIRLIRKIPKDLFSESELSKINRLINTKKNRSKLIRI
jgi:hypothetical protein